MTLTRRAFTAIAGTLAMLVAGPAAAQEWPSEPITILVGYPAGGANDLTTRTVVDGLSERLGTSVVVENRTGAAGVVAGDAAYRADPDGHTLYMMSSAQTLAPSIRDVRFDPTAFEPITLAASGDYLLLVRKDLPAESVEELIALARQEPGGLTYASSGIGAGPHLTGELFKTKTGTDILHVPYRGDTPVLTDLLAGRVDMGFVSIAPSTQHVESGDLHALAVSGNERHPAFPDLPTVEEAAGLDSFDMGAWWGLVAPPGTPPEILAKVREAMQETLQTDAVQTRYGELGFTVGGMSGEAFGDFIASEVEKFRGIVEEADIKVE